MVDISVDAAGKGCVIKRITERVSPRVLGGNVPDKFVGRMRDAIA